MSAATVLCCLRVRVAPLPTPSVIATHTRDCVDSLLVRSIAAWDATRQHALVPYRRRAAAAAGAHTRPASPAASRRYLTYEQPESPGRGLD